MACVRVADGIEDALSAVPTASVVAERVIRVLMTDRDTGDPVVQQLVVLKFTKLDTPAEEKPDLPVIFGRAVADCRRLAPATWMKS